MSDSVDRRLKSLEILCREQDDEIQALKQWKAHCTIAAAGWGGMCMAALTIGGLIHGYWDSIKAYIKDLK